MITKHAALPYATLLYFTQLRKMRAGRGVHHAATDAIQMRLSCASMSCEPMQAYDAVGATGGADYPVTDLLQMMGRASRPDIDDAGRRAPSPPEPF